ncbi:lipase secretion chaperone [Aquimonas voraii]|uniref:Lipase chaperone n=1 Tax=Aquimonas voraii TaxID=265719 RepID=A0A1G6SKZ6_9GAMM|nr:lipase secretion chaperone [Aquimonas voraii]SDD16776.1 Lipase chaperone LimK [Aquimonas voraii]
MLGLWLLGVLLVLPQPPDARNARVPLVEAPPQAIATAGMTARAAPHGAQDALTVTLSAPISSDEKSRASDRLARSSLRGSEVDGELRLAADGRLRMDAATVRFSEYHLALLGELQLNDIHALLAEHAAQRLGARAVAEVMAAFERYLGLRQALAALPAGTSLTDTLQARRALERQWFGEDAEAMFGEARDHDARTVQRLDSSHAHSKPSPEAVAPAEREARSALLAEEQSRQFEALGLPAEQRRAEREALWGAQAAARLDALDAERAAWDGRLQAYARERDRLVRSGTADAAALNALRQRSFDPRERLRVEGMERSGTL